MTYLTHYGVLGMKWGKRRNPRSVTKRYSPRSKYEKETDRTTSSLWKPVRRQTDDELRRRLSRIDMEQKYNKMRAPVLRKGAKIAGDLLKTFASAMATKLGETAADNVSQNMSIYRTQLTAMSQRRAITRG